MRPITRINIETGERLHFESIKDAVKTVPVTYMAVHNALKRGSVTNKTYKWEHKK